MPTGLVYHPAYLEHDTGRYHPECPERLRAVLTALDRTGLRGELVPVKPRDAGPAWLSLVHSPEHIAHVSAAGKMAATGTVALDPDTAVSKGSVPAALKAAGGVLAAVDQVMAGKLDNAFCLVRPPGHHAEPGRAMGFCLYNSVAIAARYLQRRHGMKRVLIVDWDVHHGNGTQAAFWDDPSVLYYSIHQYPFYPGSGAEAERGAGEGEGATLNSPMSAGCGDTDYLNEMERALVPAAREFRPDFVLVSAGFDAHRDDPLGGMGITETGFAEMTGLVRELADSAGGKLVSVLEGGYNLDALAASILAHLMRLKEGGP